jgi:drug/metabolite transporter (DMT)-like permease
MTWQIAIAISMIANVATILVQRGYSQKSQAPATFPPAVSYLLGVLPVGLFTGFFLLPHHITWSWWLGGLLVLEGIVMAMSNWTGFAVASKLSVAPLQTINRFYEVVVILLAWTVLGEGLTMFQFIGATILLVAALLAIWAPMKNIDRAHKKVHLSVVALALVSAITLAIGLVTEKAILGHMQIGGGLLVGWTAQTIAMLLLASKDMSKPNLRKFRHYELKWSVLMGLANGVTGVFYVYAIVHSNNISLVTAVTAIVLPVTALGAYVILHERENHKLMWLSLTISFVGLIVTALH